MAIDFGGVRIGIAFSDPSRTIASPYKTYKRINLEKDVETLINLSKEKEVSLIVLGLPFNMDGSEGEMARKTRDFGDILGNASNIKIEYIDERLTSLEAEEMMIDAGLRREERKKIIDKLAASLILESYLNKK